MLTAAAAGASFDQSRQIVVSVAERPLDEDDFRGGAHHLFGKLSRTHRVIHATATISPHRGVGGIPMPDVIELSFANRRFFDFGETDEIFPTHLDQARNANAPDLYLGTFRY